MSGTFRHLAWHHCRFTVPAAWEVIKYRTSPENGQLVLSDRYGVAMQVSWLRLQDKPQVPRRLAELALANLPEAERAATAVDELRRAICEVRNWWLYRPVGGDLPVFAGRYLDEARILLNIALPPHPKHDPRALVEALLASYQPNGGDPVFWAICGLDFSLPSAYRLDRLELLPAAQRVSFETRRGHRAVVYRYGMMSSVLQKQGLAEFFARISGRRREIFQVGEFQHDGRHAGVELEYRTRGSGAIISNLLAREWGGRVLVWAAPELERIYAIENHAPLGQGIQNLEACLRTT